MKKIILPAVALLFITSTIAQDRAFAITSQTKGSYNWNTVREIDLATGQVLRTIFDPAQSTVQPYDAISKSAITINANERNTIKGQPTATGVAAAAYDAKTNRLYFTNMRGDELRYFDLNTNDSKVFYVQGMGMAGGDKYNEANVITRMTFASDGFGYAITNDGKSLIRFTTDQKPSITNLGQLIDGKKNGAISIHNQCSSWGGDMVGDAYGNLYIVTMRNNIFKVNPQTRIADYVGQIKNLPATFTSNGMAVSEEGDLVVSCATLVDNYFKVNISTLEATVINANGDQPFNSSDLAGSRLLYQSKAVKNPVFAEVKGNKMVSIYPNPVATKMFNVEFEKVPAGKYQLVLTDASGRNVLAQTLKINASGQLERINLPRTAGGGMYLIKLTGEDGKVIYSDKIVVQ